MRNLQWAVVFVLSFVAVSLSSAQTVSAPVDSAATPDPAMLAPVPEPSAEAATAGARPGRVRSEEVIANPSAANDKGSIDFTATASGFTTTGVLLQSKDTAPSIAAKLGGATASDRFSVFDSAGTALFTVRGDRRVAVGTSSPTSRFSVLNVEGGLTAAINWNETSVAADISQADLALWTVSRVNVPLNVTNSGSLVANRSEARLNGAGTLAATYGHYVESGVRTSGSVTSAYGTAVFVTPGTGTITNGYGVYIADVAGTSDYAVYANGANDTSYFAGNVGIGTASPTTKLDITGDAKVSGALSVNSITSTTGIKAVYQDLAEWVPSSVDVPAGTVVVLDPAQTNQIMPSSSSYDTSVAGVVSENPGVLLGVGAANKEMVATTGRVKVRVDARQSAIRVGDLLVTSDLPGTAMRSEPMDLNGRKFHQPGTIIGKALEPLEGGIGEILVLLSMQ